MRGLLVALALLAGSACTPVPGSPATLPDSGAAELTWGTSYDTGIEMASFFGGEHTLAVRFMAQYERSYEGPLLAAVTTPDSSSYAVDVEGREAAGQTVAHLGLRISGQVFHYLVPDAVPEPGAPANGKAATPALPVWRQLFLVRRHDAMGGSRLEVWLDEHLLTPLGRSTPYLSLTGVPAPAGPLRIGQRPADLTKEARNQFYGFVDDVAVYDHAFTRLEIRRRLADPVTESAAGLVTGINFDRPRSGDGPKLRPPSSLTGTARIVEVSATHDGATDASRLPILPNSTPLGLPFAAGEVWEVVQEFATTSTHGRGFAWDFVYVPPGHVAGTDQDDSSPTDGRKFVAAADGTVTLVLHGYSTHDPPANWIVVKRGQDEYVGYAHLRQNSAVVTAGQAIHRWDLLGVASYVGTAIPHLHLEVSDRAEAATFNPMLVTRPAYFTDYCVSRDLGGTWTFVPAGMPRRAELVRRPAGSGC